MDREQYDKAVARMVACEKAEQLAQDVYNEALSSRDNDLVQHALEGLGNARELQRVCYGLLTDLFSLDTAALVQKEAKVIAYRDRVMDF